MKNQKLKFSWLLVAISMTATAELKWVEQPTVQQLTTSSEKSASMNISKERVAFNQSLLGQSHHGFINQGYQAESKQYWLDSDANQLAQGVSLPLTSKTAIIRINPLQINAKTQVIEEQQVDLSMAGNKLTATTFVNAQQLKATGMPVSDQTIALKVMAQAGDLNLKVSGLKASDGQFVIHVFEPESDHVLYLKTTQQSYATGADVVIKASINNAAGTVPMKVNGYVTAPNGEKVQELNFKSGNGNDYEAVLNNLQGQSLANGLWEVHTITEASVNGMKVLRDASTAFAINLASAQFNGQLKAGQGQLSLGIENAVAARYEIRGTLLGHDENGSKKPIALMMTAQWLESGQASLSFDWPADLIELSGLKAPFLIKGVALKNQSSMATVQRVEGGIILSEITTALTDLR